jgi:hypothetical protein
VLYGDHKLDSVILVRFIVPELGEMNQIKRLITWRSFDPSPHKEFNFRPKLQGGGSGQESKTHKKGHSDNLIIGQKTALNSIHF